MPIQRGVHEGDEATLGRGVKSVGPVLVRHFGRLDRLIGDPPSDHGKRHVLLAHRIVRSPHGELKLCGELGQSAAVDRLDGILERQVSPEVVVELGRPPIAVGLTEPPMNASAQRVHDPAGDVGQLVDVGKPAAEDQVPQNHFIPCVLARRPVLGEALGPPERKRRLRMTGVTGCTGRSPD